MASLPPPTSFSSSSSTLISTFSSCPRFFNRTSPISIIKKHNHLFKISICKAANNNIDDQNCSKIEQETSLLEKVDRRNVVLGLGGLCSAATSLGGTTARLALADPILTPDFTQCELSTKDRSTEKINCCPPTSLEIIDFKPLPPSKNMRVRPAAHLVDKKYIEKFERAIKLMKELPEDDPRNFTQQANVHCAYCNGGYDQVGQSGVELQVHNSWLFYPFHRWQLYFFEKILGKLIDDPNFTIPFWNWDAPVGMHMPLMYTSDLNSPLFNENRNQDHLPRVLVNLQDGGTIEKDQVNQNLYTMHREMLINGKDFEGFFGKIYRAGDTANPGAGSVEQVPHISVHKFCGDPRQPLGEDMGALYSSGRDILFYALHANVDRMWTIRDFLQLKKKKKDVYDPDWLNATYLFYDENKQLVRVKAGDSLVNKKLGYIYQDVGLLPWLDYRPKPKFDKGARKTKKSLRKTQPAVTVLSANDFPVKLDKIVRVTVPRPKKSRSQEEKEEKEEKLVIEGIEVDSSVFVQFDVYVNDEDEGAIGPENTEFAGSFLNLPHAMKMKDMLKTNLSLSISDLLDDLGADDDDSVVVTLVPKSGTNVTICGLKIEC